MQAVKPEKKIRTLAQAERAYILAVLKRLAWNRTHTADALRVSVKTIRTKIREYREAGIQVPSGPKMKRGKAKRD